MRTTAVLGAAVIGIAGICAAALADDVVRKGTGDRRAALDKMELTEFPADAWGSLADWRNGDPLAAAETEGNVVLIATWSSWYRVSHSALPMAQRMHDRYGEDGLIVVGVHHPEGWDHGPSLAESRNVSFRFAHDADGKFREAMSVFQDPAFYVIDRAGQLRYADIMTGSVDRAVSKLLGESVEDAATLADRLAARAKKQEQERWRTQELTGVLRPGQILDVPFDAPDAAAYRDAAWPEHNNARQMSANNVQGQRLPADLSNVNWLSSNVPSFNGRALVVDFWATWCGPCLRAMPTLDELQRQNRQDLIVVAMSGQARPGYPETAAEIRRFMNQHRHAYYHANDTSQTLYQQLRVRGIPHVLVVSTDGVVRWQGNPLSPDFRRAVEQVLRVDPGVQARRAAEQAYLERQGG